MAEKGTEQPRSLAAAFYEPINGTRQLEVAVQRITTLRANNMNNGLRTEEPNAQV